MDGRYLLMSMYVFLTAEVFRLSLGKCNSQLPQIVAAELCIKISEIDREIRSLTEGKREVKLFIFITSTNRPNKHVHEKHGIVTAILLIGCDYVFSQHREQTPPPLPLPPEIKHTYTRIMDLLLKSATFF